MSKIEILLVDDEESVLEVSKLYLEKMNKAFHVNTIDSAIEAMNFIKKNNLDVIISDYQIWR